jgi:hypothetical protein
LLINKLFSLKIGRIKIHLDFMWAVFYLVCLENHLTLNLDYKILRNSQKNRSILNYKNPNGQCYLKSSLQFDIIQASKDWKIMKNKLKLFINNLLNLK